MDHPFHVGEFLVQISYSINKADILICKNGKLARVVFRSEHTSIEVDHLLDLLQQRDSKTLKKLEKQFSRC